MQEICMARSLNLPKQNKLSSFFTVILRNLHLYESIDEHKHGQAIILILEFMVFSNQFNNADLRADGKFIVNKFPKVKELLINSVCHRWPNLKKWIAIHFFELTC